MNEKEKLDVLILGSGNILFGDDGFGPAVVEHLLKNFHLPKTALALDVGTGIQDILFDIILSENPPSKIIVVDVFDQNNDPGKISWLKPDSILKKGSRTFSLHLPPPSEMLEELEKKGVKVELVLCQPAHIPDKVQIGLSKRVSEAVLKASLEIYKMLCREADFSN